MTKDISGDKSIIDQLSIQKQQAEQAKKRDTLGQEEFLKLLVAQIKNQNPMQPQDNGEFLGQMAQFSTVSGLQQMQKSLDTLTSSMTSNQALQASSLVGRSVLIPSDKGYLEAGKGDRFFGAVDVAERSSNVNVQIATKSGVIVKSISLGEQDTGSARFAWDGTDNQGKPVPPGEYVMKGYGTIAGKQQALGTQYVAQVDSVSLGSKGEPMKLNIAGIGSLTMDQIKEIFQ